MEKSRGRPKGHRLSEQSKKKISESKTGYTHSEEAKNKISASLMDYFETEMGQAQIERQREVHSEFWNSYRGKLVKSLMSGGLKKYWSKRKQLEAKEKQHGEELQ